MNASEPAGDCFSETDQVNSSIWRPSKDSFEPRKVDSSIWQGHWKNICTFKQAQKLMIEYLLGKYTGNPWSEGGIDKDSIFIDTLVKINEKGMITVSSQPRANENQITQREYISGFVLTSQIPLLQQKLEKHRVNVYSERLDAMHISLLARLSSKELAESSQAIPLTWIEKKNEKTDYQTNFWFPRTPGTDMLDVLRYHTQQGDISPSLFNMFRKTVTFVHLSASDIESSISQVIVECLTN